MTEDDLAALAAAELSNCKVPRRWHIGTDLLPRTASGTIQKFVLRGAALRRYWLGSS